MPWLQRALRGPRFVVAVIAAAVFAASSGSVVLAQSATPTPSPGVEIPPRGVDEQIVLSGRVLVPRGQVIGEVVVFTGRVVVGGVVQGDVVVLDGPITVSGQVSGSVVALDGQIRLFSTAQVGGDVLGRDTVILEQGARVQGRVRQRVAFTLSGPLKALGAFLSWLSVSVSTLLLGLALVLLAPKGADRVALAARSAPWASAGWGVVLATSLPIMCVAAIVTIVGLPLGLSVLLALALLLFVGYTCAVFSVGRAVAGRDRSRLTVFLAGWGIAAVVGLVPFVSGAVWFAAAVYGLGATIVAVWRARRPDRMGRHRRGYVGAPEELPTLEPVPPGVL